MLRTHQSLQNSSMVHQNLSPTKSPVSGRSMLLYADPSYPEPIVFCLLSRIVVSADSDRKPDRPGSGKGQGAGGLWEASMAFSFGDQPGRGREGKTEDPCEGGKKDYLPHWVSKGLRRELKKALDWLTGGFQCRDSSISPLCIHPCLCACCRFYSSSIRWVMCSHLPFLLL